MACMDVCPKGAIHIEDSLKAYNAVIDEMKCVNCNACWDVCQSNNDVEYTYPIQWKQGWIINNELRAESSSGGAATSFSRFFIEKGGIVCSCTFSNGKFEFEFAESMDELNKFKGSKYVKSNPIGIYKKIREKLKDGNKVLFIALPCQVAAVKRFVKGKIEENLFTVDLICHGTPSPILLKKFLNDYGYSVEDIRDIKFRKKNNYHVYKDYRGIVPERVQDTYTHAFLICLDYTENCYFCKYACIERVSDITIGDSWGSNLKEEEVKGISLVLCQTDKGKWLINNSGMHFEDVDIERAVEQNHQLRHPSIPSEKRKQFLTLLQNKKGFNQAFSKCYPNVYYRQKLKGTLVKLGLIKSGVSIKNNTV